MSQVAKALLDSAPRGAAPQPPRPHADAWAPEPVLALLRFREDALTAEVAAAIGAAVKAAAPRGKAAAAAAGTDAFEDNLDRVLALGWAHVDRIAFEARLLNWTGGSCFFQALAGCTQSRETCAYKHLQPLLAWT